MLMYTLESGYQLHIGRIYNNSDNNTGGVDDGDNSNSNNLYCSQ